ncbi:uncharacterized protein [Blastocystis hominis]|uniref:Mitochondrial carrier protein n=1 Tax=Blastocystis hominis TaxID=12968 RepID=D8LXL4_BLAHO|nr:uncharacterized protein [Blastocystis hominis]CBK20319.2 unnamed protein product [Blastocystis hominis]|eukprot:XP_012894367.1 uncharacterized protein [Blastocystis hominis]
MGVVNLLAGMGAGPTSDIGLFPLDSLKTRMQSGSYAAKATEKPSLGRGIGIAMVGSSLTYGTHWTVYEYFKRHLSPLCQGNEAAIPFVSPTAQIISSSIRCPFEVIKQHLQIGIFYDTKCASGGVRAFYTGYKSLLYKSIPYDAIEMTLYEIFRKYYKRVFKTADDTSLVMSVSSGYLSSGIAAFVTTPMDVVKTRMMLSAAERNPETSVIQMFRKIYRVFVVELDEL